MQNWQVNPHAHTAESMIQQLAGVCNGARTWDGAGFSKMDTDFGHSLAQRALRGQAWSEKQAQAALKLIRKYRKQLGGENAINTWLMKPTFAIMPFSVAAKGVPQKENDRKLTSQGDQAVFRFGFNRDILAQIKQVRGEHKGKKFWASWNADRKSVV